MDRELLFLLSSIVVNLFASKIQFPRNLISFPELTFISLPAAAVDAGEQQRKKNIVFIPALNEMSTEYLRALL